MAHAPHSLIARRTAAAVLADLITGEGVKPASPPSPTWLAVAGFVAVLASPLSAQVIIDPAALQNIQASVCYAETFETVPAQESSRLAEGLVGKAYETTANYTVDVEKILPQGSGTISWWARHDFDSTAGASLLSLDQGGSLYLNFYGTSSSDPRHKEIGHLWCKLFGPQFARFPGTVKPQTWHHFVIAWEGDEVTAYFDGGLCSCQSCDWYSVRATRHIIQSNSVTELDCIWISTLFSADTNMKF